MSLPPRTADTMSDAIALSSPNGCMSKRAKDAASRRLAVALFGPNGLTREECTGGTTARPLSKREKLVRRVSEFRELASRGLSARKYNRKADQLEAELALLPDDAA